jgi:hypothetical protein
MFALALAQAPGQPPQGDRPGMAPGGPGRPGMGMPMMGAPIDSFVAERDSLTKLVAERIKGREDLPSDSVFRNVKIMHGLKAGQMLRAMDRFGHSLGVSCKHCHVENHWADDDKQAKQIARDMMVMTGAINDSLLPHVHFRAGDTPHVGCFTCHRGQAKPGGGGPPRPPQGAPGQPGAPGSAGGEKH